MKAVTETRLPALAVAIVLGGGIALCLQLSPEARLVPLVVAIPGFALACIDLWRPGHALSPGDVRAGEGSLLAWLMLLAGVTWGLGMLAGIPAYLILYLRVRSKERWITACSVAAGFWLLLYLGFVLTLGVPLYEGRLWNILS